VPAHKLVTSRDVNVSGVLSANFYQAFPNGSIDLTATVTGTGVTKVQFFDGNTLIGEDTTSPYEISAGNLSLGVHNMYAKVFADDKFNVTNIISVQVGDQLPYLGTPFQIPGVIETGNYDKFEGGKGQNISYYDSSQNNQGNYRTDEDVDALTDTQGVATIQWITAGEWLEYTIEVQNNGLYDANLRYASGNTAGGGPLHFEIDGAAVGSDISMPYTGNWTTWVDKTINGIPLTKGKHILRLAITNGDSI
jgi:hypothetical protein